MKQEHEEHGRRYWLWMSGPIVEDFFPGAAVLLDESERWYSYIVLPQGRRS